MRLNTCFHHTHVPPHARSALRPYTTQAKCCEFSSWAQQAPGKRGCRPSLSHLWQALDRKEDLPLLAPREGHCADGGVGQGDLGALPDLGCLQHGLADRRDGRTVPDLPAAQQLQVQGRG